MRLIPPGLHCKEMADEEVLAAASQVGDLPHAVLGSRDDGEVEVLVGLDESVDHLHGGSRINVGVELSHGKKELTLQLMGVGDVGVFRIVGSQSDHMSFNYKRKMFSTHVRVSLNHM